jgi:polyphenol oxidase
MPLNRLLNPAHFRQIHSHPNNQSVPRRGTTRRALFLFRVSAPSTLAAALPNCHSERSEESAFSFSVISVSLRPLCKSLSRYFFSRHRCDYTYTIVPATKTSPKRRVRKSRVPPAPAPAWTTRTSHNLKLLQIPALSKLPWLIHVFSTAPGGISPLESEKVLNLGFTGWDTRENVQENRRRFQTAAGAKDLLLVTLKQIHSDVIHVFDDAPSDPCRGDASITKRPNLLLAIQTADCVPILLVDPRKRAIAAIHAGWRGTLARIAAKTIGKMQMHFATNPRDLLAAIGPSIGPCCYEVGTEVATQFLSQFADAPAYFDEFRTGDEPNPIQWLNMMPPGHQPPPKGVLLDLRKANRSQLLAAGLRPQNIHTIDLCTACHPNLLFSYRKQGPHSGRLMSIIALRP